MLQFRARLDEHINAFREINDSIIVVCPAGARAALREKSVRRVMILSLYLRPFLHARFIFIFLTFTFSSFL